MTLYIKKVSESNFNKQKINKNLKKKKEIKKLKIKEYDNNKSTDSLMERKMERIDKK